MMMLLALAMVAPHAGAREGDKINWKPIGDAILRITGRKPPKVWNVYQDEKKKERVLVEMDNRYLILDAKTKQVYEITSAQFQLHGPAERIEVELTNENISFDVELPHPLELRVPVH